MAAYSGYAVADLIVGDTYTAVAGIWRDAGAPTVAVTADGVAHGATITATAQWVDSRYTFVATATEQTVGLLRLDAISGRAYLGGLMVVPVASISTPYTGPFFDGALPNTPIVRRQYLSTDPAQAASIEVLLDPVPHFYRTITHGFDVGPMIASAYLRSDDGAQVTLRVRASDDDAVLAAVRVSPNADWARFSAQVAYGRSSYLEVEAIGSYSIDEVLFEPGTSLFPPFHGSSGAAAMGNYRTGQLPVEYETTWAGAVNNSISTMRWLGSTFMERCEGDWRPWIAADTGEISDVTLDFGYVARVPAIEQASRFERRFNEVSCIEGPSTIAERALESGVMREVDFILVAGSPFSYGASVTSLSSAAMGSLENAAWVDPVAPVVVTAPLFDPDCAAIPAAPRPPAVPNLCVTNPSSWQRYWVDIASTEVAAWSQTVPTITLTSLVSDVRQVRVRFHPNPFGFPAEQVDPLSWCSEFIVSYLPAHTQLTVDGMVNRAYARVGQGVEQSANHLLYGTDGVPMSWPELSCGIPYVMTVDLPAAEAGNLTLGLQLTRRS